MADYQYELLCVLRNIESLLLRGLNKDISPKLIIPSQETEEKVKSYCRNIDELREYIRKKGLSNLELTYISNHTKEAAIALQDTISIHKG